MESLKIGEIKVTWLRGGNTHLDGGAMFGVVPKILWSRKYKHNDTNHIYLRTDPLLVQTKEGNMLIDSGIGNNKMNEKMKRNQGITEESSVEHSLAEHGLTAEDIHYVLMTHLHFDHASGLTKSEDGELVPTFPNAKVYVSEIEWNEMRNPNIRSRNTYWKENWEPIVEQIVTFKDEIQISDEVRMVHTGGHSDGHAVIVLESKGETMLHLADLLPTHAHQNVLWVMAYDDYPMTSIEHKQKWMKYGTEKKAWFTFYHDAYYRAVKWDEEGNMVEKVERKEGNVSSEV
ncbi:YtnP family quorum-quenching lactonase [Bacillus pseudomycoides]|uniref:MBL fold metallo-hydrolase n=1 Tax=Bacillus pseudomycoides TaxID=64104 RepID=A0AAJ2DLB5_9BACI|nr:MBL fold metallo-hydrolase [Bacillus pseudomycoides]KFN14518.1 metallo-beta-lactamase superfamily protein [Bacillus pseudomycoides]MDR4186441.1 MBL fold metallo-hydrolase [Bacillus pseudomycoides]MDR4325213.1 MBL fold metallo-hydrolase [Bacillus pseudomycoides]MED0853816.1 MBL fold metallo-hydrolase [Bacillus pseudomycoides]MED1534746.1 MBL fold metallo-hydrolase [Bacillus pseudomycoides]